MGWKVKVLDSRGVKVELRGRGANGSLEKGERETGLMVTQPQLAPL